MNVVNTTPHATPVITTTRDDKVLGESKGEVLEPVTAFESVTPK